MLKNAVHRLRATAVQEQEDEQEVVAQFDRTKDKELRDLQNAMRGGGVVFKLDKFHLYHKTNQREVAEELMTVLKILDQLGHKARVVPGVLARPTFSVKCETGLVLQRLNNDVRLFFFIP